MKHEEALKLIMRIVENKRPGKIGRKEGSKEKKLQFFLHSHSFFALSLSVCVYVSSLFLFKNQFFFRCDLCDFAQLVKSI